mmetsp:Transcript_55560/g.118324  ORF Transcript_55560/g.118324 Transcript_55560/m.118324 type:complete len:113 (-) Transcript_55560:598-936(-)
MQLQAQTFAAEVAKQIGRSMTPHLASARMHRSPTLCQRVPSKIASRVSLRPPEAEHSCPGAPVMQQPKQQKRLLPGHKRYKRTLREFGGGQAWGESLLRLCRKGPVFVFTSS